MDIKKVLDNDRLHCSKVGHKVDLHLTRGQCFIRNKCHNDEICPLFVERLIKEAQTKK